VRGRRGSGGFTLVELMIASFLSLVVVLAMGRIIQQNVRSWQQGRDKALLQQNVTEALEWMSRWVRASRTIQVVSSSEFRCYDETGTLTHTFKRVATNGGRLRQDGIDLVDRTCTSFTVTPDADTTRIRLALELEDNASNRVAATTRATIRNRFFEY
jgi:Tfp pilus assembly protein PilV